MFFTFYGQFWNILAQVNLDFKFLSLLRVSFSLLQIGGAIILAAWTGNPVTLIVWASVLSVVQLFYLVRHARQHYQFGTHWRLARRQRLREISGFTLKTFLVLAVNNILSSIDRLVLGRIALSTDFAHYTICSNAGLRISGLSISVMGPIFGQSSRAVGSGSKVSLATIYDESFDLMFGWLVLISVWLIVWKHPLLTFWLGHDLGAAIESILPVVVVAYSLTSMANISGAQLGPLDKVGLGLIIHTFAGILVVACVYLGWRWNGLLGVAYGFLISRIALLFQDIIVAHIVGAAGWLKPSRWLHLLAQVTLGAALWVMLQSAHLSLAFQLLLALAHGSLVSAWLIRKDVAVLYRRMTVAPAFQK
jgi:O-antigen/teichoic acid export membrane protein